MADLKLNEVAVATDGGLFIASGREVYIDRWPPDPISPEGDIMPEADKVQAKALGAAFVDFILGLKDGVDFADAANLQTLIAAGTQAVDDIQTDTDAAIAYALSGAAERYGDTKLGEPLRNPQ